MADEVRTSVIIDGSHIKDTNISSVSLYQEVGVHHSFTIRMRQDTASGLLSGKAKGWIGKDIVIGFDNEADIIVKMSPVKERFKGIVTQVGISRRTGQAELVISGKSPTITLEDHPRTRSFTDKGLLEIIDEVIQDVEGKFPSSPIISPKVAKGSLPYTVQYQETNLEFIMRQAVKFGEWCYYDGLDFYFGDEPASKGPVKLDFNMHGLLDFGISAQTRPGKFELNAYDYEKDEFNTEEAPEAAKSNDAGNTAIDQSNSEVFAVKAADTYTLNMAKPELKRRAKRREQIALDDVVIASGSSRNPNLKLGVPIEVGDELIGETYGTFIITSLTHDIMQGGDYQNNFEAIAVEAGAPIVTTLSPPPSCPVQLAKVTNVADDKSMGRVKVKFYWQEGTPEESPWIRVATPYMGADKGFYIVPEVDDHVLVAFESNHPEFPYVLSGMYHGKAKPEWFDMENRYKGYKSKGENQWKFDDKDKSILISAPASMSLFAGSTISMKTGGKADSSITIDTGEGTINISAKTINITAAETVNVNSGQDIVVTSKKKISATSGETFDIISEKELTISATDTVDLMSKAVSIEGESVVDIAGKIVDVVGNPINLNS